MAEETKSNTKNVASEAPLTNEMLFKMLLDTQKQLADAIDRQSESIIQSRIPYVDPKVLEAKKHELDERAKQVKLELYRRQETKRQCHHHRVDSQDNMQPKLNIKWMRHSNGIIKGVCGRCFSEFDARNPADLKLLRED